MPLSSCPVCGGRNFVAAVPAAALSAEQQEREEFVQTRLRRKASRAELKDLTDFMHGSEADLLACYACGLLLRAEDETRATASYEEDPNDPDLMAHVYPRYVEAFREKTEAYKDRLPPHASVIELGSHIGGFLQAAEEWNWRALGLDIGRDTSEFVKKQGLTVRRETIEDTKLPAGSADAIMIWNCFEQLAEPHSTLVEARRLLRAHGLLLLRVPNARAYLDLRSENSDFARGVLAWNNLLAFPYLYGYTAESLTRLVRRYGFEPVRGFNSELLTMPFPDSSSGLSAEQKQASEEAARWSTEKTEVTGQLSGPWLEILFRKQEEIRRCEPRPDLRFLHRATESVHG